MNRYNETLVPCEFIVGFYKVPGYPYSVSECGLVYSYHQERVPPAFYDPKKVEENKYIHADKELAHRLVAITFLKLPEGKTEDECLVNHLNGLKYDNRKQNLEWTDYKGNSTHAYETGLREDNRRIKSLNVLTGEIKNFYSLWDCGRFYEVNAGRIHGYLNRKIKRVLFLESYLLVDEEEDFPPEAEWKLWKLSVTEINHIAFNRETKKGFLFQTRKEAFRFLKISVRTEQKMVKQAIERNTFEMPYQEWVIVPYSRFRKMEKDIQDNRLPREVRYANYKPQGSNSRPNSQ